MIRLQNLTLQRGPQRLLEGAELTLPVLQTGLHNAQNLACAVASARALGVPLTSLADYPRHFHPSHGRMEIRHPSGGWTLLDDAYNASPASTRSALETLRALPTSGRRAAVLGDMLELGPESPAMHEEIGRVAAGTVVRLVTLGDLGRRIAQGAAAAGLCDVHEAASVEEAAALIRGWAREGDVVLVKASRGMRLDRVVELLV